MAFTSAIAFVLLGLSLFLLDLKTHDAIHSAQILAFCALLVGGLHTLAYVYAVDDVDATFRHNPMALHTAVLFAILGMAVISARPHLGFAAVFSDPGLAGRMARRVIPTAIFFTVAIGWIRLLGERLRLYTTGFGLAVFATATIAMLAWSWVSPPTPLVSLPGGSIRPLVISLTPTRASPPSSNLPTTPSSARL